ncbi:hypothetical protein GCM10027169_17100 [Gordonia jinhuaensis]|uniref:Uncharacterized protein n=1 Tax=Gordonia jinhuaensis TaxID=1517702 RepID=A0A916TJ25_9ACTN|nr:hypothetical protein [Gordonia jinhuaensis]GGB47676.1 hypothetical protein GCM10011489_38630 [Gordonia jinhuaensis]
MSGTAKVGVKRILYKEVTAADLRKLRAESNDAPNGGGARDLRLPYGEFDAVIEQMLPGVKTETRRRGGVPTDVEIRVGRVTYRADSASASEVTVDLHWEPPTDARNREGRLARVHDALSLPATGLGRVFLLLIQDENDHVNAFYAYEDDLRSGQWRPQVAKPILECLDDPNRKKRSVQGYIDYTTNKHFCHGVD